jgi:hypothetical protein
MAGTVTTATAAGRRGMEESQGNVRPTICAAGVPTAVMVFGVDLGTSALEGSNVQKNRATDFGSVVALGGGDKAGESEDVLGAIAGGGGGSGFIVTSRGGWQWQLPKPKPPPLPASRLCIPFFVPFCRPPSSRNSGELLPSSCKKKEFLSIFLFFQDTFPGIPFCRNYVHAKTNSFSTRSSQKMNLTSFGG